MSNGVRPHPPNRRRRGSVQNHRSGRNHRKTALGLPLSKVQLSAIIRELKDREYILVKYFTPDEYCLSVIKRIEEPPKAVAAPQSEEEKPAERTLYQNKPTKVKAEKVASKGALFVMSLLGSLIGSAIVAIVTVLVIKFL